MLLSGIYPNFSKDFKTISPIKHFGDDIFRGLGMTKAKFYLCFWVAEFGMTLKVVHGILFTVGGIE